MGLTSVHEAWTRPISLILRPNGGVNNSSGAEVYRFEEFFSDMA
ncbi:hypothetical protein AA106555_2017 [Neokomagataea thailandica NBRC 106555]|uniref:Uncharacterized protein n=1 Tax=Neokomagataea thailandica NBRC 106555 TaxID=1223520 RepID=A0ABQ0QSL7_9PROT|nr:hypothetical protein AA106555_2017 [Neokomagataea thailandica NBRC 106555]